MGGVGVLVNKNTLESKAHVFSLNLECMPSQVEDQRWKGRRNGGEVREEDESERKRRGGK